VALVLSGRRLWRWWVARQAASVPARANSV
jgi:hypothetical protein